MCVGAALQQCARKEAYMYSADIGWLMVGLTKEEEEEEEDKLERE